jgi:triacylglycerol lipase
MPAAPALWREGLVGLEAAALVRSDVWRGIGQAAGDDRPVLLIPGFLAGDGSLAVMTRWLRALGYRTSRAGIKHNIDCSEAVCCAMEERLERMADKHGRRVSIVGQSRGGIIARALAVRRPDLVEGIVTLGSPVNGMLHVRTHTLGAIGVVGALGTLKVPHMLSLRCLRGDCCKRFREALETTDFPDDVGYTAVFSRRDGIVRWKACLDPAAGEHVEVRSSHIGMALHPEAFSAVGRALSAFGHAEDLPVWTTWAQAA